ncbi:MAG: FlgD immunoglobulin-like domain containing protein [candidate division WOR-3 bacterium]
MGLLAVIIFGAGRLLITEVMANPKGPSGAHWPEDRNEFVEVYNTSSQAVDLHDAILDDGDKADRLCAWADSSILSDNPTLIIGSTWLGPGCYAVVLDSEYCDPNPLGGEVRPYRFGESTLILTTHNTTIGNGLATTDPVTIITVEGDTATFGTPKNPDDSFPSDPGDGLSWERIWFNRPDMAGNWAVCRDPSGSTPGRRNSVSSFLDLGVCDLALEETLPLKPKQMFSFRARVTNQGSVVAEGWRVCAWFDLNQNSRCDQNETFAEVAGWPMAPGSDSVLRLRAVVPEVTTDLWIRVSSPDDADTLNNRCRLRLPLGQQRRLLHLSYASFSPNHDGFEDSLPIVYRLPAPDGQLTITIFNLSGQEVKRLFSGRPVGAEGVLFWDGLKENGEPAPTGIYAVWLEFHCRSGTVTEKLPVVLLRR